MANPQHNNPFKTRFIEVLDSLDRYKDRDQHFRNFCTLSYCALAKQTACSQEEADSLEERYMSVVHSYKNKDDVRKMPELMTLTLTALQQGGCDFLGELATELEILDKQNGQFFTPYHVATMMSKILLPDIPQTIEQDGFFSASDPAAGAGCMLLSIADQVEAQGFDLSETLSVEAIELNRTTYHMLFVQLALRGIPAHVVNGNSLTQEIFEEAYTPISKYFVNTHGCLFKQHAKNRTIHTHTDNPQLNLFGF
ncbi:N-6 DNA methylase [Teredinibacter turnerae]|uniref:N-6 DNA methylase n=1 Tax=Teredinibacter turnerae TaxID=2426 RepID=UPI000373D62A|nr:N-6 DNA methylase [Teredinibacter turnerae]